MGVEGDRPVTRNDIHSVIACSDSTMSPVCISINTLAFISAMH